MTTYIEIEKLRIFAYHGVFAQERIVGNLFEVSTTIYYDFTKAIETDDLQDTISYAEICEIIKHEMLIPSNLLEHIAGRIIKRLKAKYKGITSGEIRIAKLTPPIAVELESVAVNITW